MIKSRLFLGAILAATFALAACDSAKPSASASASAESPAIPVSVQAIVAGAKGFNAGAPMSARTVYVFFDAQCSHCGTLWDESKPLQSQARFVWIPVHVLNKASLTQGATLLKAPDPVAAMNEHKASMTARGGGITAGDLTDADKAVVEKNTTLMKSMGLKAIPHLVTVKADGTLVSQGGSMSTASMAQVLGLTAPLATFGRLPTPR